MTTKPVIRRRWGIWTCRAGWDVLIVGHGYSPAEAYRDWQQQWVTRDVVLLEAH